MIAKLKGQVVKKFKDFIILDTGPVGYKVFVPASLQINLRESENLELWTSQIFREKEVCLYGFNDLAKLGLFELLLSVSGVGPRMAMSVISQESVAKIKGAVLSGKTSFFTRVSGIGKKNAARIILELKPKLDQQALVEVPDLAEGEFLSEVGLVLKNLGYSTKEIRQVIKKIDTTLSLEEKVKQALKYL